MRTEDRQDSREVNTRSQCAAVGRVESAGCCTRSSIGGEKSRSVSTCKAAMAWLSCCGVGEEEPLGDKDAAKGERLSGKRARLISPNDIF